LKNIKEKLKREMKKDEVEKSKTRRESQKKKEISDNFDDIITTSMANKSAYLFIETKGLITNYEFNSELNDLQTQNLKMNCFIL